MSGAADAASDDGEAVLMHGALVVPDGAPEDYLTLGLRVPVDPLPLSALVAGRLRRAFAAGAAVYICSQDEAIVQRLLPLLQRLADTSAGSAGE